MNRECVRSGTPLVDAAMYSMEGRVQVVVPGETPCLACLYPEVPPHWKRRFPVIGAVSALVAQVAALEGIKLLAGFGEVAAGELVHIDAAAMAVDRIRLAGRREGCEVCGGGGNRC